MILGGLAVNTGFSAAEIEAMDDVRALAWWGEIAAYNEAVRAATPVNGP